MKIRRCEERLSAIGKRMRKRRLRALKAQRALERQSDVSRDATLKMLGALCGKLECGHFDADEIAQARAALIEGHPDSRQAVLPLRRSQRA